MQPPRHQCRLSLGTVPVCKQTWYAGVSHHNSISTPTGGDVHEHCCNPFNSCKTAGSQQYIIMQDIPTLKQVNRANNEPKCCMKLVFYLLESIWKYNSLVIHFNCKTDTSSLYIINVYSSYVQCKSFSKK